VRRWQWLALYRKRTPCSRFSFAVQGDIGAGDYIAATVVSASIAVLPDAGEQAGEQGGIDGATASGSPAESLVGLHFFTLHPSAAQPKVQSAEAGIGPGRCVARTTASGASPLSSAFGAARSKSANIHTRSGDVRGISAQQM
jgi:hypothetical protein